VSEGMGDQRHIIVRKKPSTVVKQVSTTVDPVDEPFRAFSLLTIDEKRETPADEHISISEPTIDTLDNLVHCVVQPNEQVGQCSVGFV
jgi:hypothetical protein